MVSNILTFGATTYSVGRIRVYILLNEFGCWGRGLLFDNDALRQLLSENEGASDHKGERLITVSLILRTMGVPTPMPGDLFLQNLFEATQGRNETARFEVNLNKTILQPNLVRKAAAGSVGTMSPQGAFSIEYEHTDKGLEITLFGSQDFQNHALLLELVIPQSI